ncbi:hypothetical protein [Burkholderia ambifaria]|uniref:hypothetical protein n=1 Tax=Burkholderia ambifaria TaxID=152480 RepID=UPI0015888F2D|nr:hypothetical protein [Burkholderia ambifaria]
MKDLIISLVIDALVLGSYLAWKVIGMASAGTFFIVLMWIFTVFMAIAILHPYKPEKASGFLSSVRWFKGCVVAAVVVSACIYAGLVALAICYSIAWMFLQTKFSPAKSA